MTVPIRIAVVGMGKIAVDEHLPAIAGTHNLDLVATVSRSGEATDGLPVFASMEELAASSLELDAVALCTPPQVRHDIAQTALEKGWHVFLEKPPGATLAEVVALRNEAAERELTLFASWHSRFARNVEPARIWLKGKTVEGVTITWREDVRVWHPEQDWIWAAGGFGVFDPGINALSIATRILALPMFVERSVLQFPANRDAPIAARVDFRDRRGAPITLDLDFRQEGPQFWDIEVHTDAGTLKLGKGGAVMTIDGQGVDDAEGLEGEYPGLYKRFAALVRAGISDVDVSPLRLVADAFLRAKIERVEPFIE